MNKLALFLYKRICVLRGWQFGGGQVEEDLVCLHPGERAEHLKTEYYVRKLTLTLTILFAGAFLGFAVWVNSGRKSDFREDGVIHRGEYQEKQDIILLADDGENVRSFQVNLHPRALTWKELEELSGTFWDGLESLILNENSDLQHVRSDLLLSETYEGFPFWVTWESSRTDVLDESGKVGEVEEEIVLVLKVELSYEMFKTEREISVTVVPPIRTREEQEYLELQNYLIQSEEESRESEKWTLPSEWKGLKLQWSRKVDNFCFLIWAATPAIALVLYFMADKDLHKELEERRKSLQQEYPELIHKILLYVGAGMTIRGAFKKISGDYEKGKEKGGRSNPAYEEMLFTCRELQGGISEGVVYERFGKRAGTREYIRLGTLLSQNLKRGNRTLTERLREEAEKASGENLLRVKKLGEEAGTKMLLPMVMMLAVVMVMIMVPAFGTM